MKKFFTLAMLFMFALNMNAQQRVWDFRKGFSQETIANLVADAAAGSTWTDYYTPEANANNQYFESKGTINNAELTANVDGEIWTLPEFAGLKIYGKSAKHICITIHKNNDDPHLWINGKSPDAVTIPAVPANSEVTIIYASHSGSEARGFSVSGNFKDKDGRQKFTTVGKRDTVVIVNTGEDAADLKLTSTSDHHIYYIGVDAPLKEVYDAKTVGYVYEGEQDGIGDFMKDLPGVSPIITNPAVTVIDASATLTMEQLEQFDAVVLGSNISADNANAALLKDAVARTPILNFSTALYTAWGEGEPVATEFDAITVADNMRNDKLFRDADGNSIVDENGNVVMVEEGQQLTGLNLNGTLFQGDAVIATVGEAVAAHRHNVNGRNAYLFLPYTDGNDLSDAAFETILPNALIELFLSKQERAGAPKPTFAMDFKESETTITIKCSAKRNKIFYTLDGTDPTTESTLYTEPIVITEARKTIKAVAIAEGYDLSAVASQEVTLYHLAPTPQINVEQQEGKAIVTITSTDENAIMYFNLTGDKDAAKSQPYTEPFEMTINGTVYAFANGYADLLASEMAQAEVVVGEQKSYTEILTYFKGADATLNNADLPNGYNYKNGWNFYDPENLIGEDIVDGELVSVYAPLDSVVTVSVTNDWMLQTAGQPLTTLNATITFNIHDVTGYNPATVFDAAGAKSEITSNAFQFSGVNHQDPNGTKDPASAAIFTKKALQGPFSVTTYTSGKNGRADILVATDTIATAEWTKIGEVTNNDESLMDGSKDASNRIWKKSVVFYDGTDQVFVKLASGGNVCNIFNVLVKAADVIEDGISEMTARQQSVRNDAVYTINGQRVSNNAKSLRPGLYIVNGKKFFVK